MGGGPFWVPQWPLAERPSERPDALQALRAHARGSLPCPAEPVWARVFGPMIHSFWACDRAQMHPQPLPLQLRPETPSTGVQSARTRWVPAFWSSGVQNACTPWTPTATPLPHCPRQQGTFWPCYPGVSWVTMLVLLLRICPSPCCSGTFQASTHLSSAHITWLPGAHTHT